MKRIILIFFVIAIQAAQVFSQTGSSLMNNDLLGEFNKLRIRDANSYMKIEGSPYLTNDFVESKVFFNNGDSVGVPLHYDIYKDELEFKQNGQILWLDKANITKVRIVNDLFELHKYKNGNDITTGYFFCVKSGKNSLLKKISVTFMPADPPKAYQEVHPDRFEKNDDEYYINTENEQFFKVKNRNDLEEKFTGKPEIIEFIKSNKIKPTKEKDLIKLINYLNSQNQ